MVIKCADESSIFKQECYEPEKLVYLVCQAARASNELYERPTRRIIDDTEQVLDKALAIVLKCRSHSLVKRVFTIIPTAQFRKVTFWLENSIGDVSWLLRVSAPWDREDEYFGLPPIAANEPMLGLIWEHIAILYTGSGDLRADAASSLVSLARDNDRNGKLIIEEGGVGALLKLVKEGKLEGQENAARAIGLLGRDLESVEHMVHSGVCSVFAKILKEGPVKVQAIVAWAVSELFKSIVSMLLLAKRLLFMEITSVAEEDAELRRSAFKPSSPACKAVVDQLLRIIELADSELLIPCIKAIGNLARTFRATET
ncbi:hypothetical protein Leryth_016603 [Lithospermum erythrorhizon]|nr:hypothetical protein Leryth_016603 [Lithospermum erythrorhizon]